MSFFKIRSCINSAQEAEIVILKLFLRAAVCNGSCLSYRGRMFLNIRSDSYHILRPGNPLDITPETVIEVPKTRPGDAIDRFIDGFIYEIDAKIGDILIHKADLTSDSLSWWFISEKDGTIKTLLGQRPFSTFYLLNPSTTNVKNNSTQEEAACPDNRQREA